MGDRTYVTIKVRKTDLKFLVDKHFQGDEDKFCGEFGVEDKTDNGPLVDLGQAEMDGGNWEDLEKFLWDNNTEYDKDWGEGANYGKGDAYARLIDGKMQLVEIYAEEKALLKLLQKLVRKPPEEMQKAILKEYKRISPFVIGRLKEPNSINLILELAKEGGSARGAKRKSNKNK